MDINALLPLIKGVAPFILVMFLRDFSFAVLAKLKAKVLDNKDVTDDWIADVIDIVVATAKKIPSMPWAKK